MQTPNNEPNNKAANALKATRQTLFLGVSMPSHVPTRPVTIAPLAVKGRLESISAPSCPLVLPQNHPRLSSLITNPGCSSSKPQKLDKQ
jgi:hypothetical protein